MRFTLCLPMALAAMTLLFSFAQVSQAQTAVTSSTRTSTAVPRPTLAQYRSRAVPIRVPPGNHFPTIPPLATATKVLLQWSDTSPESGQRNLQTRYAAALVQLERMAQRNGLIRQIKQVAPLYGISPLHILGIIAAEQTLNIDYTDNIQWYALSALSIWQSTFTSNVHPLAALLTEPEFNQCHLIVRRYEFWDCVQTIWARSFRGQIVRGIDYADTSFSTTFFNPMNVGRTYGIGQMSSLRALMVTDIVNRATQGRMPILSAENMSEVYRTILNVESSLHYIAANLATAAHYYRAIANFDITDNPGITGTLYNMGSERTRARNLFRNNEAQLASNRELIFPRENYYGWVINDKRSDLEALLARFD